jgi:precorrin-2 dehydrogenase / sirohydrochlorin ferrochelatase
LIFEFKISIDQFYRFPKLKIKILNSKIESMKYEDKNMTFMPVSINLTDKEILIIGAGKVAFHKIKIIQPYTNNFRIVAKEVCSEIKALGFPYTEKEYETSDLQDAFLVYACTDIKDLNQRVYDDAHAHKILVNVVDNPPMCDFVSPAIYKKEHMTVSVASNAQDVYASIRWRDIIRDFLVKNPVD